MPTPFSPPHCSALDADSQKVLVTLRHSSGRFLYDKYVSWRFAFREGANRIAEAAGQADGCSRVSGGPRGSGIHRPHPDGLVCALSPPTRWEI
jgi:hypothetical protein